MLAEIVGSVLGGLGLFFIGIKLIGTHLQQMTGRRFRGLIMRAVDRPWRAGLLGAAAGAITQSTNAVTFIVMSLVTARMVTVRKALPLVSWANVGTSLLVLVATFDLMVFVFYLLGLVGMGYYFNVDKSSRFRHLAGALLGVGLLFLGLQFIKTGAAPLRELEVVRDFLVLAADSYVLVFLIGLGLTLITQSSATVSVVAVVMTSIGLFTMNQTMMIIYGASLGSAFSILLLTANLQGIARQLALYQMVLKGVGVVVLLALFILETRAGIPLVQALVQQLTSDISLQAAWVYLIFQVVASGLMSVLQQPTYRLLQHLSPTTREEELARPVYLYDQALDEAESALDLVEKEQARLLRFLPDYLPADSLATAGAPFALETLYAANRSVTGEAATFITDLMDRHQDRLSLQRMINIQGRNALIGDLQDSVREFTKTLDRIAQSTPNGSADNAGVAALGSAPVGAPLGTPLGTALCEGLHALLSTLVEANETLDADDLQMLQLLTSDRTELMERIRHRLLREGQELPFSVHEALFAATSLFERIVWLMRRYALLLAPQ
jgi:phosphate:Na+ symporter